MALQQPPRTPGTTENESFSLLPKVLNVQYSYKQYDPPLTRDAGISDFKEYKESVEFLVTTNRPFLPESIMPVLFVGGIQLNDFRPVNDTLYCFFAFDYKDFPDSAMIYLGFPYAKNAKVPTGFVYKAQNLLSRG